MTDTTTLLCVLVNRVVCDLIEHIAHAQEKKSYYQKLVRMSFFKRIPSAKEQWIIAEEFPYAVNENFSWFTKGKDNDDTNEEGIYSNFFW